MKNAIDHKMYEYKGTKQLFSATNALVVVVVLLSSIPVWAAKIRNPQCEDLFKVSDKFTPEYLAVVDGYNRKGKLTNDQVDVAGIMTESDKVKEECAKNKTAKVQTIRKEIMATAETGSATNSASTINPVKAKCSDFVALGEDYQPIAAFWVAGHLKAGKIKNGEIDEEYFERPVATLVEECKAEPTASFYDKAKEWFKKHI